MLVLFVRVSSAAPNVDPTQGQASVPMSITLDMLRKDQALEEFLLGVLALAFMAWAGVVLHASRSLGHKIESMRSDFHLYAVATEHRLTIIEGLLAMAKVKDSESKHNQVKN